MRWELGQQPDSLALSTRFSPRDEMHCLTVVLGLPLKQARAVCGRNRCLHHLSVKSAAIRLSVQNCSRLCLLILR